MSPQTRILISFVCLVLSGSAVPSTVFADPASDSANWSPRIQWIAKERIRATYNYSFMVPWYAEAKRMGLNAVITRLEIPNSPEQARELRRTSGDDFWMIHDLDKVQASGRAAKEQGIHLLVMVGMGASAVTIEDGFRDNPRRYNNGEDFSPLDEIYWTRVVENRFLWLADMLQGQEYQLDGFMIDPEMYAAGARHGPDVDYGDYALEQFTQATGIDLEYKSLSIAERAKLIDREGLEARYEQFQFERIKSLAARTRERVQAKVPDAILGFFIWRNTLWYRALAAGFSTPEVPCLVATESTYPGTFDDQFLNNAQQLRQQAGASVLYIPGVAMFWGKSPEYLEALAANSYHRAIHTDGYWIYAFGLLGDTPEQRRPYFDAFGATNRELIKWAESRAAGSKYESSLAARPVPIDAPPELSTRIYDIRRWQPIEPSQLSPKLPPPTGMVLRGKQIFYMKAKRGDKLALDVRTVKLGSYASPTVCQFYRPGMTSIDKPEIPPGEMRRVEVVADEEGYWACVVASLNNAFEVMPLSRSATIWPPEGDGVWLCTDLGKKKLRRCFFVVPESTESFKMQYFAEPGEPATFRLFAPDGKLAHEHVHLTEPAGNEVRVDPDVSARVWWLESENTQEDHHFSVFVPEGEVAVAARPEQLLVPD